MKGQVRFTKRCLAGLTALAMFVVQLSVSPPANASALGSSTASAGSAPPPAATAIQSFQPDLFTGRATTSVPIAVPPGRKGMQPSLALAYSSSGRNSWVGVGWSLDVAYIERSTKNGVPKYDATDTYTFMFQGVGSELVQIPDGTYRAKDEGLFLRFTNNGVSGWEVRDKSGTRYLFGETVASQIENSGKTFRWCLDKILDVNGNTLLLSYAKNQGQLYLSQIRYTGHEPTALAPTNQVDFILENRSDFDVSFRAGFEVTTAKRLKSIEAKATVNSTLSLARRYDLSYRLSARTGRSLLASVTQVGADGVTSLPPITFSYQDASAPSYALASNASSTSTASWNLRKANVDTGNDNFGCVSPYYSGLPWGSSVVVSGSVDLGCVNASVGSDGSITVNGCKDHFMHAWTWVYTGTAKSISLSYTGAEACMYREDATGVQQIGGDGTATSVPLQSGWSIIHLTGYHQHEGWTNTLTGSLKNQVDLMSASQFIRPQLTGDVDGNGTSDLIAFDAASGRWTVSSSSSVATAPAVTWLTGFGNTSSTPLLGDWNSDGRTDIAVYANGSWQFATSTGTSFQTGTIPPLSFGSGTPLTGDFNGDGRIDLGTYNNGSWSVALSTGSGFAASGSLSLTWGDSTYEPMTGDFNGDGFTDIGIIQKSSGNVEVRSSLGAGWTASSSWLTGFGANQPHTSADFNGDGLTDLAYYDKSVGQVRHAPSTGTRFGASVTLPVTFSLRSADDQLQVADFNGDGLADPSVFNGVTGNGELARSQGTSPDLASTIANGVGGTTTLTYQPSSTFDNTGQEDSIPDLPFVIPVVTRVDASDGMGNTYTTRYTYEGGRYDAPTKEFRGFRHVDVSDAANFTTHHWFLQAADTKGRIETQFTSDESNNRYHEVQNVYLVSNPYPGVTFTSLNHQDVLEYNGDTTFRETHTWFWFDQYGNLHQKTELGEDPQAGDERQTTYAYTINEAQWMVDRLAEIHVHEGTHGTTGPIVSRRFFYYDDNTSYTYDSTLEQWIPGLPLTKGNLTRESEWLVSDPKNPVNPTYPRTNLTYDAYGNVKTVTDALNRVTTNTYDSSGTYLIQIANALGHTRQMAYEPRLGQVISTTDQNGVTSTTEYDALGRVTKVIGPNDTSALPTIEYEYDLSTVPTKTVTHTRVQSGASLRITHYAFNDGLGRTIQTRSPAEDLTKQVVGGAVEYDARGLAIKQWVPYLDAVSTSYVPASQVSGLTSPVSYTYDIAGRLLTTTDPDGAVTSTTYDDWSVTVTDAKGHQTRRTSDSLGRLATVEEFNSGQTYTTAYQYDVLNNLTQVTDAASHVTRINYDSLGRKIAMDDPDMGVWTYVYDAVDNLTSQTDARGVVISFAYDALNRLIQKSYSVPPLSSIFLPPSVLYTYDNPAKPFSRGKLTEISDGSGSSSFEYDNLGRLIKESKTVDGTTYTIQRAYDLLGRLTSLTYPDSEAAIYTYNPQGGIETVVLQSPVSGLLSLVSNVDYNAAGQLTKITYGNGVVTDYSYNPQTLRLASLRTTNTEQRTLQDFSYTFDANGNVTDITDRVHTGSQTFQYDDLNRLTQAVGAYGTHTYAYDPIGNMTEKEGATMRYGENGAGPHAVTAVSNLQPPASSLQLSYDANGNLVSKEFTQSPNPLITQSLYSYDAENRLTTVETAQEETVTVTFKPGWNFFALPVLPDDGAVVVLLPSFAQDFEQIAKFEPATNSFKHYVGNPKFNDFSTLEYGVGYQVFCKRASDLTVSITGKRPTRRLTQSLAAGWHLLPAAVGADTPLATWLSGVSYGQVKAVDPATGTLSDTTTAKPNQAYWVQVAAASTWTPPLPKNVTTSFVYDGDGGKVKQTTASGTTTYLGEVYEKASSGEVTKYVFAGSQRITAVSSSLQPPASSVHFYHGDHLGSSNVLTDASGQLVEFTEHLPYGAVAHTERTNGQTGQPANPAIGFTGQRQDTTNGLILFPARAYDPQLGRFLQADPFVQEPGDPQTLNRYSYVRNNPINLVDLSGYGWFRKLIAAVVAVIVAAAVYIATGGDCPGCAGAAGAATYAAMAGTGSSSANTSSSSPPSTVSFPSVQPTSSGVPEGSHSPAGQPLPSPAPARAPPPPWLNPLMRLAINAAQRLANWDERTASVVKAAVEGGSVFSQRAGVNELSFIKRGVDVYGKGISYAKVGARATFIQFRTLSPFSRGTIDELTAAVSFQGGAGLDALGVAFKLSAHLMNISSEYRFLTYGDTTWSAFTETGIGAQVKGSLFFSGTDTRVGFGLGLGPTVGAEIRMRNRSRWED